MRICPRCLRQTNKDGRCTEDGATLLELGADDPRIGVVAAERFLILDLLGEGGMGVVYRAYQLAMDREIALKVLPNDGKKELERTRRFDAEAKSLARLRSPHTVAVYDFGELASGELYIAMEMLNGTSLASLIEADAPLHPRRVQRLMDQICQSLEEAHDMSIVHRDIKPSNIMVERFRPGAEHVKVLDFGVAKYLGESDEITITGAGRFCGTPAYMAPELWSNERIGPGSDIYALGVLMYQMLTKRRPFAAKSDAGMMHQHLYDAPPPLDPFPEDDELRAGFEVIIETCLEKKIEDRFRHVSELRAELAELVRDEEPSVSIVRPSPRPSRLRELARAGAFVVFSAAAIAGGNEVIDLAATRGSPSPAQASLRIESAPSSAQIFLDGEPTGLVTPAQIRGLTAGEPRKITVLKDGFESSSRTATPSALDDGKIELVLAPSIDRGG